VTAPQALASDHADVDEILSSAMGAWRPPPKLSLSEWADEHFYLSPENAAVPGRWKTLPYQKSIMDAMTDPGVERVTLLKSARIGYTLMVSACIGYYIQHEPCPILGVQPTVDDARGYSKETIAPMLRDVPVLAKIVFEDVEDKGPKSSGATILHKTYPGGVLSLVGANSGSGFRRVSRKVVIFDEVDAYPQSAGSEGDAIKLGTMRSQAYWDRKILAGSTPLVAGTSRIEALYLEGDQQRFFVPCPHCGHMAPFVFRGEHGHRMEWPDGNPDAAFFSCQGNGCVIEHSDKRGMVERGEWRAANPQTVEDVEKGKRRHASFHLWTAYSFNENTAWADIAREFLAAKANPKTLQVFVNTWLGETWQEQGEAPDWELLYARREHYPVGVAPPETLVVTAGVDVQKDRFVYEVVGWGRGKENWSLDAGEIYADTANDESWLKLDELLARDFGGATIRKLALDSGFRTNTAYNWARRHPMSRVIAVKGVAGARAIIGLPSPVDVHANGKRIARGYKVFTVGTDIAKE
jgi:phage terminase large subunit GpA-like protein